MKLLYYDNIIFIFVLISVFDKAVYTHRYDNNKCHEQLTYKKYTCNINCNDRSPDKKQYTQQYE